MRRSIRINTPHSLQEMSWLAMQPIKERAKRGPIVRHLLLLVRPAFTKFYLQSHSVTKLHIGAGYHMLPGWLNADLVPYTLDYLAGRGIVLDARQAFPFRDNTFDYIFSEHMIEHLTYYQGVQMLRECHRTLRTNGTIRIATPDLVKIIGLAAPVQSPEDAKYIKWAVDRFCPDVRAYMASFVINNFFHRWGHQFIYDRPTLRHAMEQAGFVDIVEHRPGESDDACLRGLEGHGAAIGEDVNRFETLILEGRRPESRPTHEA